MDCNKRSVVILFCVTCTLLIATVPAKHIQTSFDSGQINSVDKKAVVVQPSNLPSRQLVQHRFIKDPNSTVLVQQRRWIRRRNRQHDWRQRLAERRSQALRRHFHTHVVDRNGRVLGGLSQRVVGEDVRPTRMIARLTIPISTGPQTMVTSDVQPVPTESKHLVLLPVQRPGASQLVGKPVLGTNPRLSTSPTHVTVTSTQEVRQRMIDNPLLDKTAVRKANLKQPTDLQDGNLSILRLLNDRQPVIKEKEDEAKLKNHLLTVSQMEKDSGLIATDQRLIRMQLEYIYAIQEAPIKREVLKLFVKDIVEKSGFSTQAQQSNADIAEMASLFELIKSISANNSAPIFPSTASPKVVPLSRKINVGLDINNYRRPEKTPEQVPGINLNHLVGLSVYGDRPGRQTGKESGRQTGSQIERPNGGRKVAVTTTISTTTFEPHLEPLGGNDAYWTHLSVGFQDMLCALCQRQNKQTCVNKYCQNDEIAKAITT